MSFATAQMILPVSAAADKVKIDVSNSQPNNPAGWNPTLAIVGLVTTEQVAVQIPRVAEPVMATDAHWTPMMQDGEAVVLNADNKVIRLPGALIVRLVKDAGIAGNEYGVRWT